MNARFRVLDSEFGISGLGFNVVWGLRFRIRSFGVTECLLEVAREHCPFIYAFPFSVEHVRHRVQRIGDCAWELARVCSGSGIAELSAINVWRIMGLSK